MLTAPCYFHPLVLFGGMMFVFGTCGSDTQTPVQNGDAAVAPLCANQGPVPGTPFFQGGSTCTTSDGRSGTGHGSYGCIANDECFPACQPEKGKVSCKMVSVPSSQNVPASAPRCVYESCSGANQDETCQLASGGTGMCCSGICVAIDALNDPHHCGGCGLQCAPGASCQSGVCTQPCNEDCGPDPAETCGSCPSGQACVVSVKSGSTVCASTTCAGQPDGAPCGAQRIFGLCCSQRCIVEGDNANCGGCGVACCPGLTCSPTGELIPGFCS